MGISITVLMMGLYWFRQREEMDAYDWGKRNPAERQHQAKEVTANAFTQAQIAIAKAAASAKAEVAAFA